jgi:hypothetical protein
VSCYSVHTLTIVGWLLLAVGLIVYLGAMLMSLWRVTRLYSRAMRGRTGLFVAAALSTNGKFWPFLGIAIAGSVLVMTSR